MKPRIREDLAFVELDGEMVVYDERGGNLHHLNPTASIVFQCCDGTATIREFSTDIAEAFKLVPDDVERQVRGLLREFRKADLLDANGTKR
jgi:PqqD family protein of HPr-rel-A system